MLKTNMSSVLEEQRAYMEKTKLLLAQKYAHPPLAHVHSYGCQQNVSDGEKLRGMLAEMGYGFTADLEEADLVIYNTCAVRENAEMRVLGNVGALKPLKQQKKGMLLALCGCMMQQPAMADKIRESYPYVDLVFGTHALPTLPKLLYRRLSGEKRQFSIEKQDGEIVEGIPVRREETIKAKLPVMYGCDNFCSYCIVPYVRGRERSRLPEDVLKEARALAGEGFREIMLLGQNVNSYGKGLPEPMDFSQLLAQAAEIPGDFWIRFMTSHPKDCTRRLIDTIAKYPKICRHLHLPVQSGSDRILAAMNRKYTVEDYLRLIEYAKSILPDLTFSTDIIVGFPGETEEDFVKTLDLVKEVGYTALYTFIYSPRTGTKAALMEDPTPALEKSERMGRLLQTASQIRETFQNAQIGKCLRVLAEAQGKQGGGWISGRTQRGDIVEFLGETDCIGSFVQVRVDRALNWALFGTLQK